MTTITVNYVRQGDDWSVTVQAGEKTVAEQAPGLIAARDRADQLVDKLVSKDAERTVVHLLDGDAFAFTTAYLRARHGIPDGEEGAGSGSEGASEGAQHAKPASEEALGDAGQRSGAAEPAAAEHGTAGNEETASAKQLADQE